MPKIPVGSKVKFESERLRYTVQASDERFAICTKPFNPRKTVLYSIIDFQEGVRGPENLVFGMGAETREQCEDMLDRLNGREESPEDRKITEEIYISAGLKIEDIPAAYATEVTYRNRIAIDIQRIDPPKEKR